MPRISQNAEKYAKEDFLREIRSRQGYYNLMTYRALGAAADIPYVTLWERMKEPDRLEAAELRKLVKAICPDPLVVLAFLGYSRQDIKRAKARLEETA